jgi:hypothetical protein
MRGGVENLGASLASGELRRVTHASGSQEPVGTRSTHAPSSRWTYWPYRTLRALVILDLDGLGRFGSGRTGEHDVHVVAHVASNLSRGLPCRSRACWLHRSTGTHRRRG